DREAAAGPRQEPAVDPELIGPDAIFELEPAKQQGTERQGQRGDHEQDRDPQLALRREYRAAGKHAPGAFHRLAEAGQQIKRMEPLGWAELVMRSAKGGGFAHSASARISDRIAS